MESLCPSPHCTGGIHESAEPVNNDVGTITSPFTHTGHYVACRSCHRLTPYVSKASAKSRAPAVGRPFLEQDTTKDLQIEPSQTSQATSRRATGRPRGTGPRRGRGLATGGKTALAPPTSEEPSNPAGIDPDTTSQARLVVPDALLNQVGPF